MRKEKRILEQKKKKKRVIILCSLIVLCVIMIRSAIVYVYAKYNHEYKTDSIYEAENFYFESDLLTENGEEYNYKNGEDSITVKIFNNEDSLRYTEVDTTYEVKIKDLQNNSVVDKNSKTIEKIEGVLSGKSISSKNITFNNLKNGTYKVIASTKTPYIKNLEAIFVITNNDEQVIYNVNDSQDSIVLYLTVTTNNYEGDININIPDGLLPDSNDPKMKNIDLNTTKNLVVNFKNNSEYSFRFFKENPNIVFENQDFVVIKK